MSDISNLPESKVLIEKIGKFEYVEILVNDKKEIEFEGIIDPLYIFMHFERIVHSSKDFDIIKMNGYDGGKNKELIAELIVSKE